MSRNFGYSSGTGRIQGTFTLKASGLEDLKRVTFYIDNQAIGQVGEAPFHLRFHTDDYSLGNHELYADGLTMQGSLLRSNVIRVEFVSADEGWQAGMRILIPILATILGAVALSIATTVLVGRTAKNIPEGTRRNYGVSGGSICPQCQRPFPRHFWSPNLVSGKLERCPFCGKWSVVRARSLEELRAAEVAELEAAQEEQRESPLSEQEWLRRELEDTRYQDL
jgi:hypothetical protein